ncbi:hypothetical protein, partial [Gordonia sp. NPDC003376]
RHNEHKAGTFIWPPPGTSIWPPVGTFSWPFTCTGVWVFADCNKHPFEDWVASWIILNPTTPFAERLRRPDLVFTHHTAASIRELGTVNASVARFTGSADPLIVSPTGAGAFHVVTGTPGEHGLDWTLVEGVPVATPARILNDLTAEGMDGSHLGTVISDILAQQLLTAAQVGAIMTRYSQHWGWDHLSGEEIVDLLVMSDIDQAALRGGTPKLGRVRSAADHVVVPDWMATLLCCSMHP